jgi:hypothetical protein
VWSPSAQYRLESEAWISNVRITLLMVRIILLALPFCGDV